MIRESLQLYVAGCAYNSQPTTGRAREESKKNETSCKMHAAVTLQVMQTRGEQTVLTLFSKYSVLTWY
jgi:hypothetical protein